jgi:hypothetical protein
VICGRVAAQFFGRCAVNVRSATWASWPGDGLARVRLMGLDDMVLKFYFNRRSCREQKKLSVI